MGKWNVIETQRQVDGENGEGVLWILGRLWCGWVGKRMTISIFFWSVSVHLPYSTHAIIFPLFLPLLSSYSSFHLHLLMFYCLCLISVHICLCFGYLTFLVSDVYYRGEASSSPDCLQGGTCTWTQQKSLLKRQCIL